MISKTIYTTCRQQKKVQKNPCQIWSPALRAKYSAEDEPIRHNVHTRHSESFPTDDHAQLVIPPAWQTTYSPSATTTLHYTDPCTGPDCLVCREISSYPDLPPSYLELHVNTAFLPNNAIYVPPLPQASTISAADITFQAPA